ncbi:MAG: hypothetical protein ABIL01_05040 [Pseudomonadota bacterium]
MFDALIVTALQDEFDAALSALRNAGAQLDLDNAESSSPYQSYFLFASRGDPLRIALARPTRMGAIATSTIASSLVERLRPRCIAMCGVCAGNPSDVALGDVIVAELSYFYDEGKRKKEGFEGDHRQIPLEDSWIRKAQELRPDGLPTFGEASESEANAWLLEQLYLGLDPKRHPARIRYLPEKALGLAFRKLEKAGLVQRRGTIFVLTDKGSATVEKSRAYDLASPKKLPYRIHVGPMASGNVVVKDGLTWEMLKSLGVRTVLGLEMEAAAIAQIAFRQGVKHWIVAKGVMDYADPRKDDRYKAFAALSSAEVLLRFLSEALSSERDVISQEPQNSRTGDKSSTSVNVIGDVTGSHNNINQTVRRD